MQKEELISLVSEICLAEGTEKEVNEMIMLFTDSVVDPEALNYVFPNKLLRITLSFTLLSKLPLHPAAAPKKHNLKTRIANGEQLFEICPNLYKLTTFRHV